LPLPEGPSRQSNSPSATSRLNPSNSSAAPKRLVSLRSETFAKKPTSSCVGGPPLIRSAIAEPQGRCYLNNIILFKSSHHVRLLSTGQTKGCCTGRPKYRRRGATRAQRLLRRPVRCCKQALKL